MDRNLQYYRRQLLRFFKWLYYPDTESNKCPKPAILENILQLMRKRQSIYKPSDLWTPEEDLIFLRGPNYSVWSIAQRIVQLTS